GVSRAQRRAAAPARAAGDDPDLGRMGSEPRPLVLRFRRLPRRLRAAGNRGENAVTNPSPSGVRAAGEPAGALAAAASRAAAGAGDPIVLPHFIGGRFVPPRSGAYLDDIAPATAAVVARVPRGDAADVDAAVRAARAAFPAWAARPAAERARILDDVAAR